MAESAALSPGRIFISARRGDTRDEVGWLYDRLTLRFVVVRTPGGDFVEAITSAVASCDVLLALVGSQWLTMTDAHGRRRIDDPDDFVRLEIEAAFTFNVPIIPILVDGARMPRADELPTSLAGLISLKALELNMDRLDFDANRFLTAIATTLFYERRKPRVDAPRDSLAAPQGSYSIDIDPEVQREPEQRDHKRAKPTFSIGTRGSTGVWSPSSEALIRGGQSSLLALVSAAKEDAVAVGQILFNPPTTMRQGIVERVEVSIARSMDFDAKLREGLRGQGVPQIETIDTSPFMAVDLSGSTFSIVRLTPIGTAEQLVAPTARWEFDVLPLRAGERQLHLSATMRIPVPGRDDERIAISVVERRIQVRVDLVYGSRRFVAANWQWIAVTAAGLGGTITAWVKVFN